MRILLWVGAVLDLVLATGRAPAGAGSAPPQVELTRAPGSGIEPQAVVDARGVVHLTYVAGDPRSADIFYVRKEPGGASWSKPVRVNSQPGSAVAIGTVRYPQISLGKGGRVHVGWNGSMPAGSGASGNGSPMWVARANDAGTGFEPQRNVMQVSGFLDGGGSLAADGKGGVVVAWHARPDGAAAGEEFRRLFLARSSDEGRTFSREQPVNPPSTGACACCASKVFADRQGRVYILYRTAHEKVNREMVLLAGTPGQALWNATVDPWNVNT